ncbi:unnamed protein product [Prunus armeniaca]|uniref:NAF domain-containing protein n=1 Tax=Prunus armeniaca TaxID=36596 RepID=A0A6J5XFH5_PRUAR|nr:unnamed protein product [Prunus armeniaca]
MDLLRLGGGGLGLRTCLRRWVGVTRTEKEAEGITRTVKEVGGFAAVGGEAPPNRDFGVGIYGAVLREIGFINIHNKSNNHHPIELAKERRIREGTKEQERERERNQRAFGAARGDGVAWLRWVLWGRGGQKRKKGKMEVRGADEEWKKGKGVKRRKQPYSIPSLLAQPPTYPPHTLRAIATQFCLNAFDLISFSTGLDLSGLFNDHSYGSVEDSERFVLEKTMEKVVERVEAFAKVEKLRVRRKKAWGLDME